jgi:hypothetical protein
VKYVLVFLSVLIVSVPVVGKMYIGDTHLTSKKMDDLTILGVANLDNITAATISVTGPLNASNLIWDSFSVTGPISLINGTFKKTSITGPVSLAEVTSDTITITGFADFKNVTVTKELTVIGMLKASNSRLNSILLTMSESVIRDSSAKSIVVKRPNSDEPHQKLMLYGNTRIDEVIFESGQGEVHIHGENAKVENVKGAKVIEH